MKPLVDLAYDSIRAGAPGLSDATCKVIAASIARKALQPHPSQQAGTGVSEAMVTAGLISWFGREKMSADAAYVRANWGKPMRFAIQAALNTSEAWGFHTGETKGDGADA